MHEKQIQLKAAVRLWTQVSTALDYKPSKAARMQQGYVDTPEDLRLLDVDMRWRVVPGDFEVMVGKSSAEITLQGILKATP